MFQLVLFVVLVTGSAIFAAAPAKDSPEAGPASPPAKIPNLIKMSGMLEKYSDGYVLEIPLGGQFTASHVFRLLTPAGIIITPDLIGKRVKCSGYLARGDHQTYLFLLSIEKE